MNLLGINHSMIKSIFVTGVVVAGALFLPLKGYSDQITWTQRKQLYFKGTLTDKSGKTWDVLYLPGVESVTTDAKSSFDEAKKLLKTMSKKEFWQDRRAEFEKGVKTAKNATMNYWINGIKEDYNSAKKISSSISENEFGGVGGKVATWTKFGVLATGRTVTFPVGVAYGIGVESTLQPLTSIIGVPVLSGIIAIGGGFLVPGVMYVWNGAAWFATSIYSNEPTTESYYIVLKDSSKSQKQGALVIDKKGFDTLLMGSVVKALNEVELKQISEKATEYYHQYIKTLGEYDTKEAEMRKNADYKLMEELLKEAYSKAEVQLNEESKQVLLDDEKLESLIKEYLIKVGTEPTDEKIKQVKATLNSNLKSLLKDVKLASLLPKAGLQ